MTEAEYIDYFKSLAIKSKDINHVDAVNKKAFFVVDNPYDLTEVDNAIRSQLKLPAFLLDIPQISPSSNGSANYTETIEGMFMIIKKASKTNITAMRDDCLQIGKKFLFRMHYDYKNQLIQSGVPIFFRLDDCEIDQVGPIATEFHGYMFKFRFICPFGFSVSGASWTDL